jgi:energy-coupling factor transport system ATP-binding protein
MVFQYPEHQLFADTVFKDIGFGPTNMGLSGDEIDRRVRETAAAVGLSEETLDKSPFELSGGQKRRVAIAGVMAMEPEILVLDEPTAGLDPRGSEQILQLVKDYRERKNATIVFVSHSMEDIAKYATTLLVMNKGEIFAHGDTKTVFSRSRELEEIGLDVPQITRVFNRLKDKGFFQNKQVFTVPYAVELLSALRADSNSNS